MCNIAGRFIHLVNYSSKRVGLAVGNRITIPMNNSSFIFIHRATMRLFSQRYPNNCLSRFVSITLALNTLRTFLQSHFPFEPGTLRRNSISRSRSGKMVKQKKKWKFALNVGQVSWRTLEKISYTCFSNIHIRIRCSGGRLTLENRIAPLIGTLIRAKSLSRSVARF